MNDLSKKIHNTIVVVNTGNNILALTKQINTLKNAIATEQNRLKQLQSALEQEQEKAFTIEHFPGVEVKIKNTWKYDYKEEHITKHKDIDKFSKTKITIDKLALRNYVENVAPIEGVKKVIEVVKKLNIETLHKTLPLLDKK